MTDMNDSTHRPLNADTLELDTLTPREREVVEKMMADLDVLVAENFIGQAGSRDMLEQAEKLVAGMNERPEDLRLMAEHLTGRPVDACIVRLDGIQGSDLLMTHEISFAPEGSERHTAWAAQQDAIFENARAAAAEVFRQELGSSDDEADAE